MLGCIGGYWECVNDELSRSATRLSALVGFDASRVFSDITKSAVTPILGHQSERIAASFAILQSSQMEQVAKAFSTSVRSDQVAQVAKALVTPAWSS